MSEEDDFDFEYDDEMSIDEDENNPENRYYAAKSLKEDEPLRSQAEFTALIDEQPQSEWSLRAAKQLLKLRRTNILSSFAKFMSVITNVTGISEAYRDQSFSNVMRRIERDECQEDVESVTKQALEALESSTNTPRLALRAALIFARHCIDRNDFTGAIKALGILNLPNEPEKDWHPALYLEYLALQMKLHASDHSAVETWYNRASAIQVQMIHPRVLGTIREFGGLIALHKSQWEQGCTTLLKSFKSYDEAGMSTDRIRVLRLYTLASLLTETGLSPFDLPETKVYEADPSLNSFREIVKCVQEKRSPSEFFNCCERTRRDFIGDNEIQALLPLVYNSYETLALATFLKPFRRICIESVSTNLGIASPKVEVLVKRLILQRRIGGMKFDQLNNCIIRRSNYGKFLLPDRSFPLPVRYSETAKEADRREYERNILGKEPIERESVLNLEPEFLKWVKREYSGQPL